jgi:hypothetical protein
MTASSSGESSANLTSSPSTAGYRQKQCGNLRLTLRLSQAPEGHTALDPEDAGTIGGHRRASVSSRDG